ncbi:MAG: DEAD/DEAH box helicase [Gemmatimonadaceae bacterium]
MTASSVIWQIDEESKKKFQQSLSSPDDRQREWATLRRDAERLALMPTFEQLIALDLNRIEELPHQIRVAQQVLQAPMHGRAILADEVGLGKTIEAGIILKELAVRGLARRILILTPASLVTQWCEELKDKFFEEFLPIENPGDWRGADRAIASYDRAQHANHRPDVLRKRWDLVIIDEAHKCKNHLTARYKFLQEIPRNYLLLLTATPLQNDIRELYNLITLLRPGHLGTWKEFKKQYVANNDVRQVANPEALRELTSRVMVRTRRSSVAHIMAIPPRRPQQPEIILSKIESELYAETALLLRSLYREGFRGTTEEEENADNRKRKARTGRGIYFLECMRLAQRLCSSPRALSDSLTTLANGELVTPAYRGRARDLAALAASATEYAKLDALSGLLASHAGQIVVFSEHLATVDAIVQRTNESGREAIRFTGELSRDQRRRALKRFREQENSIFVSTRAGTEGLNLQFCHQLVNYELPWNPMVVEQRIGRVHRIGQKHEVQIHNYAAKGTVEAHILKLLHSKIRLFELVVGELDSILEKMPGGDEEASLEHLLGELWLNAESDDDFERKIDVVGDQLQTARATAQAQEQSVSLIAAEDASGRLAREFTSLTIPARLRFGYGTDHVRSAPGVEAERAALGIHVTEIFEMLTAGPHVEPGGLNIDYGSTYRLNGLSGRMRHISMLVQADRLPMAIINISGDNAFQSELSQ